MSEAMAVEEIIDAFWQLNGYWTKLRYSVDVKNGWTDFDVLAYNPKEKELVICESKVRGTKRLIWAYIPEVRNENKISFIDFDRNKEGKLEYLSFIENINENKLDKIYKELNIPKETKIVIHFVSNYYVEKGILDLAQEDLKKYLTDKINSEDYTIKEVIIDTTFDVFCKVLKFEKENNQGKRYGHSIIDITREINRYMAPKVVFKKGEGVKNKPKNVEYEQKLIKTFKEKLNEVLS